jgi:hypothetical protein
MAFSVLNFALSMGKNSKIAADSDFISTCGLYAQCCGGILVSVFLFGRLCRISMS